MNKRKAIIESQYEPATDSLWIHGKNLKAFINGKWEALGSNLSSEEIEELRTKINNLNKEVGEVKETLDKLPLGELEILDLKTYGVFWKPDVADPVLNRVGNMSYHRTLPIQNNMKGCIAQMKDGVKIMYYLNETDWRFRTPQDAREHILKNQVINFNDNKHTITNNIFGTLQYEHQYVKINDIVCQVNNIDTRTKTATITPEKNLAADSYDVELGAVLNGYDGEVMVEVPEFWIKS